MLLIYEGINDFYEFCQNKYEEFYGVKKDYNKLLIDYDVFILDKDKYVVDDLLEYIEFYKYKAFESDKKISFINNFDEVDIKSQNKLLKLLEESKDIHILVIKNKNKLLDTILSRGQKIKGEVKDSIFKNYPSRYQEVLNLIKFLEAEDYTPYLKFYDFLVQGSKYNAYIHLTTSMGEYNHQAIYEIIQLCKVGNVQNLLILQQRLVTRTNKNLQLENYLLQEEEQYGSYT